MATSVNVHGEDKVVVDMTKLVPSLPLETRCPPFPLRQYGGFWLPEGILPALEAIPTRFETRPSNVFRASFPKSGTTWLKALAFATINRDEHPPSDEHHPLRHRGPHDCVKFFEPTVAATGSLDDFAALPSPRLLSTHVLRSDRDIWIRGVGEEEQRRGLRRTEEGTGRTELVGERIVLGG